MIKLIKPAGEDYRYYGILSYAVLYDHSAGYADRYTVLVMCAGDPVTIGQELDLPLAQKVIADFEKEVLKAGDKCVGTREEVGHVLMKFQRRRRAEARK